MSESNTAVEPAKPNNNIVAFPGVKWVSPPQTMDEVKQNIEMIRGIHAEEILEILSDLFFDNLNMAGYDFLNDDGELDEYEKDIALFMESMRSVIYKHQRIEHPIQKLAQEVFNKQEDGSLRYEDIFEEFNEEHFEE